MERRHSTRFINIRHQMSPTSSCSLEQSPKIEREQFHKSSNDNNPHLHHQSTSQNKLRRSSGDGESSWNIGKYRWNWNSLQRKNSKNNNSVLFSSDSEGENTVDFDLSNNYLGRQEVGEDFNDNFVEEEDYTLPFVRLVDTLIYFYQLYKTNYSAFCQEIWSWGGGSSDCDNGRLVYGHNLNPREKRPGFVNRGIEYIKRRRMGKVVGDAHKSWILRVALMSRVLIFLIQLVTTSIAGGLKHNNDGFKFTPEETYGKLLDPLVNSTFGGYVNWDAHYFLHISVYGYTSENIQAFFPLLPMLLYLPSRIGYFFLQFFISMSSLVVVLAVMLNTWLFVKCTENIYDLARIWSRGSREFITTACILFCFNPASIFFSGLYTETLFAYLTSNVLCCLFYRRHWTAVFCAALSGACRSNGLLNIGFIIAFYIQRELWRNRAFRLLTLVTRCIGVAILSIVPFIMYQKYCILQFCQEDKLYDPTNIPLYCSMNSDSAAWTLPYSYVQKKYWNVGFLQYFHLKQIPNFVLATPVLYILGSESWSAFKSSAIKMKMEMTLNCVYDIFQSAHGLFLAVFCFFFVHVQVSTRMIIAACPYLFIYLAASHEEEVQKFRNREIALPVRFLAITIWCILYYLVGAIAFPLGYPWT